MKIKDFFDCIGIKYQPIELEIKGKEKKIIAPKVYCPTLGKLKIIVDTNDKDNLTDEEFKDRNDNYGELNHLVGHTTKYFCVIDVDFEDDYIPPKEVVEWIELMKSKYPYKKSTSKKNGLHIYFINDGAIELYKDRTPHTPYKHIEILGGCMVYEKKDSEIINFHSVNKMKMTDLELIDYKLPIEMDITKPIKEKSLVIVDKPKTKLITPLLKGDELEAYNIVSDWILSLTKIDDYLEWWDTLKTIKHLVGDKYKSVADELSKKSNNYGKFAETWNSIKYNDFIDPHIDFYTIFQDSMVINSFDTGNDFYVYDRDSKLWRSDRKQSRLVYFLTIVIQSIINDKRKRISIKDEKMMTPEELDNYQKLMEHYKSIETGLRSEKRNIYVKSTIERKMKNQISNVDFDNIDYLYHFKNITLDLRDKTFRTRRKDDYCSMFACNLEYDIENDKDENKLILKPKHHLKVEKWKEIIADIHEDEEVRENFIDIINCSFSGKVLSKFVVFNGNGSNGKSMLTGALRELHGDYGCKGKTTTLTTTLGSGASPEVAKLSKKRFKVFAEPDENSKINFSIIKDITGDTEIDSRKLYSNDCKTIMAGVNILECNQRLKIDGITDYSMARRLVDFLFNTCFKRKEEIVEGSKFKEANAEYLDKEWKEDYQSSLFWYLFEKMRIYKDLHNFKLCKKIEDRTKEYIESNNDLLQTIKLYAEYSGVEGEFITLKDIINKIKMDKDYFDNLTKKDKREFTTPNLKKKLEQDPQLNASFKKSRKKEGKDYYNVLLGWRLIEKEEDIEDNIINEVNSKKPECKIVDSDTED